MKVRPISFSFFNLANISRFIVNFPDLFNTRNSLVYLFFLFRYAQNSRKLFFNFYCTSCFLSGIAMRYWRRRFNFYWYYNFLFFPAFHYQHLYYFEFLILNISPQQLTYDSFYYGSRNHYLALNYKNFFLRLSFFMFIVIWKSAEHLRATCYNHYIRTHFFTNRANQRHSRFALTHQWARYFEREHRVLSFTQLSLRFVLNVHKFKYQTFFLEAVKPAFDVSPVEFSSNFDLGKNINFINFLLKVAAIPTQFFKFARIFRTGLHQWLGFLATSIMARYTNNFVQFTRFDYDHGPILFKMLSLSVYGRNRILSMWLAEWQETLFEHFYSYSNFPQIFAVVDFLLGAKTLASHERESRRLFPWVGCRDFLFTYRVNRLRVNDSWDVGFFNNFTRLRCYDGHNAVMGDSWHVYGQYWNEYLLRYHYFGDFHYVDRCLVRNPLARSYHQWRIFNVSSVYDFLQARLPLRFFYRKIELDYFIYYRHKWLWNVFKKSLPSRKFYTFCHPKFQLKKKFDDSSFVVAPFPLRHRVRYGLKAWFLKHGHKSSKPKVSVKLTSFIGFSMIASVCVVFFFKSLALNFINFFTLWEAHNYIYRVKWSCWQANILTSLYINQLAIRQWIFNYQNKWPHYRRKISLSGIHSLTNPFFRENWMRIFHKGRRTGFKKHQLPYYCYDESRDVIEDLASLIRTPTTTVFSLAGICLIDEIPPVSCASNLNY